MPKQVSIYVDGFNLYHRILETRPELKWLCLRTLFSKHVFPNNPIKRIKYFTAQVDPSQDFVSQRQARQRAYWDAITGTGVEIIKGRLVHRPRKCKASCGQTYSTPSEKMSDVNLALHIYRDFDPADNDITCVVSADLDVVPALRMLREENPKCDIRAVIPTLEKDDFYWSRQADFGFVRMMSLDLEWLQKSKLPDKCKGKVDGKEISRPETWH